MQLHMSGCYFVYISSILRHPNSIFLPRKHSKKYDC